MSRKKNLVKVHKKESDLARFARAFENEAHLQDELVILFRKMGRERVRKVHGPLEHGKDIVFYAPGGLDERSLFACVVKNTPITGEAGAEKSLRTVLQQAQEAFEYPYPEPENGAEQRVKTVYVISPFEITPVAQQSISSSLKRLGVVEFVCGASLLDLFSKYHKEFLLDSGVLTTYLSALRTGLQKDDALLRIILRHSFLANIPTSFDQMYVSQTYSQALTKASPGGILAEPFAIPETNVSRTQVQEFESLIRRFGSLSRYLQRSGRMPATMFQQIDADIEILSKSVLAAWEQSVTAQIVETQRQYEITMSHTRGKHKLAQAIGAAPRRSKNTTVLKFIVSDTIKAKTADVEAFRVAVLGLVEVDCRHFNSALLSKQYSDADWLTSNELLIYCRLLDLNDNLPGSVVFEKQPSRLLKFDASFLDSQLRLVLLSGPAGYGKTSFCRWQSLTSAEALLADSQNILPVYVALGGHCKTGHRWSLENRPMELIQDRVVLLHHVM